MIRKDVECFDVGVLLWLLLMLVITGMIMRIRSRNYSEMVCPFF